MTINLMEIATTAWTWAAALLARSANRIAVDGMAHCFEVAA